MEEIRSAFKILTGIPRGKRPLGRPSVNGRTILVPLNGRTILVPPGSISHGVSYKKQRS